ncbi:V-type ATP synthase subunit E [Clostridium botulinum C]|uniref:V-type proton ATPase subunit E n=4 Tax=Clostridium TaxID=1485 RepID=A0A9Q4THP0_CLOBO|nr:MULTISPECIES: V-type ATP synthase subunit E family protein [Clostridium]EES91545.1 ATP synthase, subunit E [Clostridium botulinum D str. 1873]KEI06527.1 ATP synthase subunit E [Clostridium sp. K25]KEI12592.1 ATP synthase subunit E [Clostridium novyi B str. NCTC 9691]KEI18112.1 ATP synthase subunit E [Clostridium novyi B str. ATCC 27606]MBO3441851.1 V-type ATP synthase subunit E [Clostridium haemolyticum]
MSNIENLTSKIIENAKSTAKDIIDKAKEKENNIISKKVSIAEKERNIILSKAKDESKLKKQRIISNANLQVRDMKLSAKIEVLDKVFNDSIQKLNGMTTSEMINFIRNSILSSEIDGDEEIIIDSSNLVITPQFVEELNKELKSKGKIGKLKLSSENRNIGGGYILAKNGIEINNTFDFLVKSLRDDIESEVAKVLFS